MAIKILLSVKYFRILKYKIHITLSNILHLWPGVPDFCVTCWKVSNTNIERLKELKKLYNMR